MAGFIRRYGYFPSQSTIQEIEGVVIVDLPPPGSIQGVGTGTTCIVGEFADLTYATSVAGGNVTANMRAVEVFSSQDLVNKVGGFDEHLGEFSVSGGNGFVAATGKAFSRLVIVPINLASDKACRLVRDLPTNKATNDPTPIVPLSGGVVAAGRTFTDSTNGAANGKRTVFTDGVAFVTGIDGACTAKGAVNTTPIAVTSAGSTFQTDGVAVGDIMVLGVIGTAASNPGTYRITEVTSETALKIEKLTGEAFDLLTAAANMAFRIHPQSTADSADGAYAAATATGYTIPVRAQGPGNVTAATAMSPVIVPPAATVNSWDSLSGLKLVAHPSSAIAYTAAVQADNAASSASNDTLYESALEALLTEESPARDVSIVVCARTSSDIAGSVEKHVSQASAEGIGRVGVISPPLGATADTLSEVVASSWPGVAAYRDERVIYAWPSCSTKVSEAVGKSIPLEDGSSVTTGIIDVAMAPFVASVLSLLPPERNPGQGLPPATTALAGIKGFSSGLADSLSINSYKTMRAQGIVGLRFDRTQGPVLQSGITTSLTSGQKNINRRRMADFLQDSISQRLNAFSKLPLTQQLKDGMVSETTAFLSGLLSENNPAAQRISGFEVDDQSGNTPDLEAQGIFVLVVKVRTLATADFIVLQTEVGEGVTVTSN
jgi:hypothetical protein